MKWCEIIAQCLIDFILTIKYEHFSCDDDTYIIDITLYRVTLFRGDAKTLKWITFFN